MDEPREDDWGEWSPPKEETFFCPEKEGVFTGLDRRRRPTPALSRYTFFGGRRRRFRSPEASRNAFVDVHGPTALSAITLLLGLNVLDSFFTLLHVQRGGGEMNPVMNWFLDLGPGPFLFWKSALVGISLVVLCLYKNFRGGRIGFSIAFCAYASLLGYHILLVRPGA
jgi:hypothetical protein